MVQAGSPLGLWPLKPMDVGSWLCLQHQAELSPTEQVLGLITQLWASPNTQMPLLHPGVILLVQSLLWLLGFTAG